MLFRSVLVALLALVLTACATSKPAVEQRTTQGPTAEQFWMLRSITQNQREPNFDERRHWDDQMEIRISQYLRDHPEDANSLDLSTFRFLRQVTVGMSKEQVLILLGAPLTVTSDQAEIEKLATRYWPDIKGNATEAWVYPVGWRLYFAGQRLVDITQYLEK